MDRAIKFRAWDYRNKRMISWEELLNSKELLQSFFGNEHYVTNPPRYFYERMQFTGLYDCEGKEIYEEDIVKYQGGDVESGIAIVNRVEGGFIFKWIIQETSSPSLFSPCMYFLCKEELTILGNIYEHPNLLTNEI